MRNLQVTVRTAQSRCSHRADVFINHERFYPRLPPEYAELVPVYMSAAREAGAAVHDGAAYLGRVKLRDHMHFADESTSAVVDMYFDAIRQMQATAREDYSDGPPGEDLLPDADDLLSMGGNDEEDSNRSSQYSEEEVELASWVCR